ncbi:sensor domain-containing diguanylate cyclase [bacterium]|nr:sensor domain-containing diguanylate cyclase [bacterium]
MKLGRWSDIGLKYARAFIYILGIATLYASPYRSKLFYLNALSLSLFIILLYILIAIWLEAKEVPRRVKKVNITLYVFDALMISWIISLTDGWQSPIYPYLFLPVIFVAFDYGFRDAVLFSFYASAVGSIAIVSTGPEQIYYVALTLFMMFLVASLIGFLKSEWESVLEKERLRGSLRSILLEQITIEEAIKKVLETIAKATGADRAVYLRYDENENKLKFSSLGYGLSEGEMQILREREISVEEGGVSWEVLLKNEPLLIKSAESHPNILKDVVENFQVMSILSFPIILRGRKLGVFHLVRVKGSKPFEEKDFEEAKGLVEEVIIILEALERELEIERRRNLLEILVKLISNLSRAINIEEVGSELFNLFRDFMPTLQDIVLVKCRGSEYSLVFYQSEDVIHHPLLQSICQRIRETGHIAFINDENKIERGVIGVPVFEGEDITHLLVLFLEPFSPPSEDIRVLLSACAIELGNILARVYSIAELERYAFHDHLTGLLNRRMFYQRMGREMKGARRYGYPISLVIMDIDDFKAFNDQYGHLEGDRILAEMGRLIREEIRASDFAARIGGEEFAIVLPHTPKDSAIHMVERLRRKIKDMLGISVSMGVGEFPRDGNTLRSLMRKVDAALYEAKKSGKGRVYVVS